jgi:GNAT superfamily N-acetyltransferase
MPFVAVRLAGPADLDALTRLCHEMERHYEGAAAVPRETVRERLAAALFGPRPLAEILLAELDGRPVALAIFAPLFPVGDLTTGLFLKEIFVSAGARRRGVGRALFAAIARLAVDRGCTRIDWVTGRLNRDARALYRALGGEELDAVYYRLEGEALRRVAGGARRW